MVTSKVIMEQLEIIAYRLNENGKKAVSFGTGHLLYPSEIHFINAIGVDEVLNATQISKKLGITNGAVTQVATKLLKKGLIEKIKKEDNKKEVYMVLTESGKIAYYNHLEFHKRLYMKLNDVLNELSEVQKEGICKVIDVAEKHLKSL